MLNASKSIYMIFTYILHLQRVIMTSHNNPSPVGLVQLNWQIDHCIDCAGIDCTISAVEVSQRSGFESCSDLNIFRSPFANAVFTSALKVKTKTKITSYQLILDRVEIIFPLQKK